MYIYQARDACLARVSRKALRKRASFLYDLDYRRPWGSCEIFCTGSSTAYGRQKPSRNYPFLGGLRF